MLSSSSNFKFKIDSVHNSIIWEIAHHMQN